MRNFNIAEQFEAIKTAATGAVQQIFPIEGKLRRLTLDRVWAEDTSDSKDYSDQAKIKAKSGTWGVPVYAALTLFDKQTGKTIDKSPKIRLFTLPKATDRFSYIVGGNEYQVHNQLRLRSGVYTRLKQNGELKSQVNLASGKNFDLMFDENKNLFTIVKVAGGQANIPLYPILINLGISPQLISREWGPALEAANRNTDPRIVQRAMAAFGLTQGSLKDYLDKTKIDPEMSKLTLGQAFSKVDGPMLLATSKKLLDVHLGKKAPEDLNSLEYKEIHGLEDFIRERLEKNKQTLARKISRGIDNPKRTKISQIVNPGAFSSTIEDFFTQDERSATPEQTNPLEMISGQWKTTIMGPGGISSDHAVTNEVREIHPTHYGFMDPIHTPESKRIGANLHLPLGVVKDGKELKAVVRDIKTGKNVAITPAQSFNAKVAFPGEKGPLYKVQYRGQTIEVPKEEVDYETLSPHALFTWSTNLIPYLPSNQGNRTMMAAKMLEQAISLKHREAPLVQVGFGNAPLEQHIGNTMAVMAPEDGVVKKVDDDHITLKTKSGDQKLPLYHYFPLNRKSYLHHEATVKPGDKVKKGQVLADNNFTKDGTLALGLNLRAAYLPYHGYNFEDGIVITDSTADKLTSVHIHKKHLEVDDNIVLSLQAFKSQYPNAATPENLSKLGTDGVIRKGVTVKMGEVVIAALKKRDPSKALQIVQRQLADRPKDNSVIWNFEDDGYIQDVQHAGNTITVFIRTEEKAKIGDKLSGRMGNKGIITKIIPDNEAPHDAAGKPVEILLNPHGVISRINIGQIYESAAGKVAKRSGKTHVVNNFSGENYLDTTKSLLNKAGMSDKEELFDAKTGKSLGKVHVGNPYILKLFKLGTANFSVRQGGPGAEYDANQQPLKSGGEEGTKALDLLTMYSMLSHGARANLREVTTLKGNQNDEYWTALKSGQQLPPPKVPFVYEKFIGFLKGAGIDVRKDGTKLTLAPLTDKQVKAMSSGEITEPGFYIAKNMQPVKDGFFDPIKLGGFKGTKWGHFTLHEPMVNPVFENAVRKVTGLGTRFDDIMAGRLFFDGVDFNTEGKGVTGGKAIEKILKDVDVVHELKTTMAKIPAAKGAVLDDLNKKARYLQALQKNDMRPEEAYMRHVMPVVPPVFRPIYALPDGSVPSAGVNYIYRNVGILNKSLALPVMKLLPETEKADLRRDLYENMRGVSGLTDINIMGRPREGFISEIKGGHGGQPKEGFFISKILSKRQDFVGRGTIIPEPNLGPDEVALPEQMAWKLFEPFIIKELKKFGKTPNQALDEIKNKSAIAKKALDIVLANRHVMLNRAPSLHKFSIMAFKPKLTDGRAIKIPPLVVKGFNADFDGDTMTVHIPISDEANKEAEKMLPSKNLYQPGTGKLMMIPSQEAQIGLFYLSKTAGGRAQINKILGSKYAIDHILDKKETGVLLTKLSKELPNDFARILQALKSEGEKHAYDMGFTLGMDDLSTLSKDRNAIVSTFDKLVKAAPTEGDRVRLNHKATEMVDALLDKKLKGTGNALYDMVESGARGDKSQLRSILATPLFVTDAKQRIVPTAIKKSYAEGLDVGDYWVSMYGARRGMIDRAIQTSIPGAYSKDIMSSTIDNVISANDCGTKKGIMLKVGDKDALERFTAGTQFEIPHNTLIDNSVLQRFARAGAEMIRVRSPLTCLQAKGTCGKCYGLDEHGQVPSIGENIGAKAGQTIAEPLTQMTMNCSEGNVTLSNGDVCSFVDLYESLEIPEHYDGHCYSKHGGFNSLIDCGQPVPSGIIQTHMPEDEMIFVKTKTGNSLVVQGNHPLWVYDKNGTPFEKLARDVVIGECLQTDISMLAEEKEAPFDPYFIGLFLAEGTTRYGNGTDRYKNKAVASILTQHNSEIKDKAFEKVAHIRGATKNKLDVQIYNPTWAESLAAIVRGREAKLKRLQPGFNKWTKGNLAELLAGWIDGDGTAYIRHGMLIANIYTSSYVALQQLGIICRKLNIRFTPQVVPREPLQKTVQFIAQLRFKDDLVYKHSVKLQKHPLTVSRYRIKYADYEPITYIKPLWNWDLPVWDVKTESRGFTCGMVRNHNTFHTGGVAGAGGMEQGGFARIDQLMKMPKIVVGAATLAPTTGTVTGITPGIAGGFDVTVGDHTVHVLHGHKLKVAKGSTIKVGDALSDGVIKPQDLVKYKGMQPAQEYIAEELQKAYAGQGARIHRKIFETVVRSLGNTTQVLNKPKGSGYIPGDVIPYTVAQNYNENPVVTLPIEEAVGHKLNRNYGPFRKGHELEEKELRMLHVLNISEVEVERAPIQHSPILKSISTLPILKKNWMSALGYRKLAQALVEGAGQSWSTDLEDYHPVPAFAQGVTFGKGKEGKY